jgi:hypothetical protein
MNLGKWTISVLVHATFRVQFHVNSRLSILKLNDLRTPLKR